MSETEVIELPCGCVVIIEDVISLHPLQVAMSHVRECKGCWECKDRESKVQHVYMQTRLAKHDAEAWATEWAKRW
jgi:hypothetical protein